MKHSKLLAAALLAAATVSSVAVSTASAADYPATKFNVVGGASHNYTFGAVERPFWNEVLPAASGGQVTVN